MSVIVPRAGAVLEELTLILAYVFQRERQAGIFTLHDPHLSKSALSHHAQQSEMVEVDCLQGVSLASLTS